MKFLLIPLALVATLLLGGAVFSFVYGRIVESRYPPTGRFLTVEGRRLHYVDRMPSGRAPEATIVLLHGASSNLVESMVGLGESLTDRYRVIAFDRPGHGWSERGPGIAAAEPSDQARIIAQGLRQLGVSHALIVGHSWSGAVVPNLALDHPDVTGAIFLMSGVSYPWPGGEIAWYHRLAASPLGRLVTATIATPLALLIVRPAVAQSFAPQTMPVDFIERAHIPLLFRSDTILSNGRDVAILYDAVARQAPRYPQIRVPSSVLGGDADGVVWTDLHSRSFARDVPGAELSILPGVGHMPQYARAELIRQKIDALAGRMSALAAAE
ncbi:alpha/beta fold hydrolase [Microvirga antarctica]|uniref:alpha/beta fold hydrolase n=1 Tax=Microvirga antarctica TaxID=2819233 RepID=UPI001B308D7E|nr:alpha/beta hydrolase [Microvirga antarctica]